ncbi:MAG TPA: DegQ family serine endoprotease [Spongiibacteraceae bacterium]|jgi:Do/DeqQ family serine protease|nr:DegQ family serine endoprotease [Spongiibacteraceae bacterium]HUH38378.1 DegQ family serine endoprotease [Spongiibacteraceae bacterium]
MKSWFFALVMVLSMPAMAAWPLADAEGKPLPSLAPLVDQVSGSVVNISTFTTRQISNPLLNDPFFRRFFQLPPGQQVPQSRRTQSAGSGVIIDAAKGIVVTNHHVVDGADEVTVQLADGRSFKGQVLGSDPEVDIAVLKIDARDLQALKLANSEQLRVGDFVMALGNPFGLGQTVTTGVVSALGRTGLGIEGYENFIQTDASINPGNSGGALVDLHGDLVGINTAILAPSGGNVGIGFAIPANMARASIEQILEHGEVRRGQLGVVIQDLTPDLAAAFDIDKHQRGVLIAEVQKDSAADKAGMKAGDVVISIDGKPVESAAALRNAVGVRRIGDKLRLTVLREGKTREIKARIGEPVQVAGSKQIHRYFDGARLQNADNGEGVVVAQIEPDSAALAAGLRPGDVIVSANRQRVRNVDDLRAAVRGSDARLLLRILRGNVALYLVLQ